MQILIPDSWLREYLSTEAKPKEIQKALSLCGPSVERLHATANDFIYDIEVTTNRVDCMSVYGIAREATAILPRFNHSAKLLSDPFAAKLSFATATKVDYLHIQADPVLSPRSTAILIRNVQIGPSPDWMLKKLESVGMRGLNNVIDISNLLMHELGQPVHTFDYDKIGKHAMTIRESRPGEVLTTLDSQKFTLPGHDIVIEDGSGHLMDLCGIMGGLNSAIDNNTKNVLLFVQTYEPTHIRKTSMSLAHRTNAAVLFEKGLPVESVLPTMEKGIQLFRELTGGQPEKIALDILNDKPYSRQISVKPEFITARLGIELSQQEISGILSSLGFVDNTIPWWRKYDISIPEDIVEEVARIYGYHNLPARLMSGSLPTNRPNENEFFWVSKIKSALKYWGFTEAYTYSLAPSGSGLKLKNPLTSDWAYLRTNLVGSHQQIIAENIGKSKELRFFEIANVYLPKKGVLPDEHLHLVITISPPDIKQIKGVVEALEDELGTKIKYAEPLGHPESLPTFSYAEINLQETIITATTVKKYTDISKFAPIIEDLNILLKGVYTDLEKKIYRTSQLITNIELVDNYNNKLTLRITYHSPLKQLSSHDIAPVRTKLESIAQE